MRKVTVWKHISREKVIRHSDVSNTAARKLDALEVEAVAISLLNSYVNASKRMAISRHRLRGPQSNSSCASHEIAIAEAIAKTRPSLKVSCSGTLSPEIREYERTSTTILNALLIPVVSKYLDNLAARMRAEGFAPRLLLVQSNGGVLHHRDVEASPTHVDANDVCFSEHPTKQRTGCGSTRRAG